MEKLAFLIIFLLSSNLFAKDVFETLSKDPDARIDKKFIIPKYFYPSVNFWFNIYTKYDSKYSVLHDKNNFNLNYIVSTAPNVKKQMKGLRAALKVLQTKNFNNFYSKRILSTLKKANIKIPKNKSKRIVLFKNLSRNLRSQTGQKDKIRTGLQSIQVFKPAIDSYFLNFKLPKELLAIPFIESSFNLRARSKVGATGVWQFMRRIGRYFMNVNFSVDNRNNPFISTISALHLLKQNLQVLKRWDLAIPAYNSGTKHFLKAKRKYKKMHPSLQNILKRYKHPHLGFASKNFYSEFLALVYAFAYMDKVFPRIPQNPLKKVINFEQIGIYLSKCNIVPKTFFDKNIKKSSNLKFLNQHIKKKALYRRLKKGTIIVSDIPLNKQKFYRITSRDIRKKYPKNWKNLLRKNKQSKNCS